jgi:chromatin segregation and condensation protein Rec8/ScpA/Scc1 (kleisin family)
VTAIGPVPNTPAELEKYLTRLDAVRRALGQAQAAYGAALERRDELAARLDAYQVKAAKLAPSNEDLAELYRRGRGVIESEPVDLIRLAALVAAYQAYLDSTGGTTK